MEYEVSLSLFLAQAPEHRAEKLQSCYVYKSGEAEGDRLPERPRKRRKASAPDSPIGHNVSASFVPLFAARELPQYVQLRYDCFLSAWKPLENSLNVKHCPTRAEVICT